MSLPPGTSQNQAITTTGFWAIRWLQINQVVDSDLEQLKSSWINYSRSHLFSTKRGEDRALPLVYQFLQLVLKNT